MPALSSSSRTAVRYIPELVFGVIPASGNPKELRITGESLNYDVTKTQSSEINNFRSVSTMVSTDASAGGDLNIEFQYAEYDALLQATMNNTFAAIGTNGVTAGISSTFTVTTIAGTGVGTGLVSGQFFSLSGTGNTALDGKLFRVSKSVAPTANLITLDAATPGVVGGPYAATVFRAARVSEGTVQTSYTIERESADIAEFFAFRGQTPSKFSLNLSSGSLSTGAFTFMGKDAIRNPANITNLPGTPVASQAYQAMSGVAGSVCTVWVNGIPLSSTFVKSLKLDYDNALRVQGALCTLGAVGIGSGTIVCKATAEIYFAQGALFFDKLVNNGNSEIVFTSFDADGNGYVFTLPAANTGSYKVNASGKDNDMLVTVELTALRDAGNANPALRKTMFIDRIGAAVTP